MVIYGSPKQIWDDSLEFEASVRSNTAVGIYIMHGEVPETVMLGGNSDISQFCEDGFYDCVMLMDEPIQYYDENIVIGRYLGPAIDVGPEMTAKIMKENGEVVHRST